MGENTALIERAFALLTSDTYEQVLPLVHESFEMVTTADVASEPDVYRGPDGVRRWWLSFLEAMEWVRLEASSFEELDDGRVVVEFVIRAKGRQSGIETGQPAIAAATVADQRLVRLEFFTTLELARAAPGPRPD